LAFDCLTWDRIHVVFPHPGGPYTSQAGWGIPLPLRPLPILDRIISMH
jgi:hypothetical protein